MKKKILTVLALVLVVAAVVVICTSCAKKEEAKEETAKIRYTLVNQTGEAITNITMKEKIGTHRERQGFPDSDHGKRRQDHRHEG